MISDLKGASLMGDAELAAMKTVYEALESLDEAARRRTLSWAADRLAMKLSDPLAGGGASGEAGLEGEAAFPDVAELIHAAQPAKGPDYALVVGYWLQVVERRDGWSGNEVNSLLRNVGHGVANITTTLDRLIKRKPALVMQTGRAGRSQQARKTYKLTTAGVKVVQKMISAAGREVEG